MRLRELPLMSKEDMYGKLQFRMREYSKAIAPDEGPMLHTVITHWLYFEQKIKSLDTQYNLFGKGFWGYGINKISDGKKMSSNLDVAAIAKIYEGNKHHSHPTFNLMIFKVESDEFIYNTFCFNLMNMMYDSDPLQRVGLQHLVNVKPKIESQNIFVELEFDNLALPLSFQMDTFYTHNGEPSSLSKAYVDYIQKFASETKAKSVRHVVDDFTEIDKKIDLIEQTLRNVINTAIMTNISPNSFKQIVRQPTQSSVEKKVEKFVRDHPGRNLNEFKSLESCLQFFDFMDYHKLIANKAYWPYFVKYFNSEVNLEKHSIQLGNLRNAIRHSRDKTELVVAEGKASIIWFKAALNLSI
jgi:hypothetical protein